MNIDVAANTGADVVAQLDITKEICPMTLVRTRLALDRLSAGQFLLVRLAGPEPVLEVPRAAEELGHQVVSLTPAPGGVSLLLLRRC